MAYEGRPGRQRGSSSIGLELCRHGGRGEQRGVEMRRDQNAVEMEGMAYDEGERSELAEPSLGR